MGDSHGLFLLVQPTGGKLRRFKYRVDGREKKLAIGPYLGYRITLELIIEIGLTHHCLLSSKLGSKASRNLGAIQTSQPGS
jgi:hypothetical protein